MVSTHLISIQMAPLEHSGDLQFLACRRVLLIDGWIGLFAIELY